MEFTDTDQKKVDEYLKAWYDIPEIDLDSKLDIESDPEQNYIYNDLIFSVTNEFNDDSTDKQIVLHKESYAGFIVIDESVIAKFTWTDDVQKWVYHDQYFTLELMTEEIMLIKRLVEAYFVKKMSEQESFEFMIAE